MKDIWIQISVVMHLALKRAALGEFLLDREKKNDIACIYARLKKLSALHSNVADTHLCDNATCNIFDTRLTIG